jgi:excisionase family DNA binding protein
VRAVVLRRQHTTQETMNVTTIDATEQLTECRTMSVSDAARVLGISRTTAYECVRTGDLPALKLGGRIVIPTQVIEELLTQVTAIGEPPDGSLEHR